jgi:DNA modification methylase
MKIEERKIDEIIPYHKNAKKHKDSQVKKIANSIAEFGFNQPIVVDSNNVIIVGHGRYLAAKKLGMPTVPVMELDLPEDQVKSYRLADNKLNESDWDMDLVIEELKGMSLKMIDLSGFNSNLILETKEDDPDLSTVSAPRSQLGDLYQLGEHKLLCGDSTNLVDYKKLLGDEKARLVFTDPPYSVNYISQTGKSYDSQKYGGTGGKIFNDDKTPEEALIFYKEILKQIHDFTTEDMTLYWWFANSLFPTNLQSWEETGFHYSQTVFWLKEHFVFSMGQIYHRIYEPCMVGWKSGKQCYKDGTFSNFSEFWSLGDKKFPDYLDMWYAKRDATSKYIHPTQKPVQLSERALKRSSEKGDIVLDCFGGSGSTLIGCDQMERKARLIELDPKYVDAIVGRWCQYKQDSTVIKNGEEIQWIV